MVAGNTDLAFLVVILREQTGRDAVPIVIPQCPRFDSVPAVLIVCAALSVSVRQCAAWADPYVAYGNGAHPTAQLRYP